MPGGGFNKKGQIMNGFQVSRYNVQTDALVCLGIGSERTAMQAAEDMSRTLGGILHVINPCGREVATFENGAQL